MIILRIGRGVIDHFPVRRSEWISSFTMAGWGTILALDGIPFYGSWRYLNISLSETAWASLFIVLGLLRVLILTVNGSFPATWYGKWAPHVRVAASGFCALAWLQLVLAGLQATPISTGVAAYSGYLVTDILNTWSGSAEAREVKEGRKNVASRIVDAG